MDRRNFTNISLLALTSLFTGIVKAADKKSPGYFVTITTTFPRRMNIREYRKLQSEWKNRESSAQLSDIMKKEGKILNESSSYLYDKIITCIEFSDKKAWNEYTQKYSQVVNNSAERKKELGFHSITEHKRTILS